MPVTDAQHDLDTRTITITAQFAAPVERIWQVYADARQLERVWGPPGYPATFVDHELTARTRSTYYMTSPEGQKYYSYWDITQVEEPTRFTYDDGFAREDFTPDPDMPVSHNVVTLDPHDGGTRVTYVGTYESAEGLQQVLDMGVMEGATSAINQIDDLVAG